MIHVIATIRTTPGQLEAVLAAFHDLIPLVRAEPGCLEYSTAVDSAAKLGGTLPARGDMVTVIEKWANLAALQDHWAAPHMLRHRERVKSMVAEVQIRVLEPR